MHQKSWLHSLLMMKAFNQFRSRNQECELCVIQIQICYLYSKFNSVTCTKTFFCFFFSLWDKTGVLQHSNILEHYNANCSLPLTASGVVTLAFSWAFSSKQIMSLSQLTSWTTPLLCSTDMHDDVLRHQECCSMPISSHTSGYSHFRSIKTVPEYVYILCWKLCRLKKFPCLSFPGT